MNYRTTRDIIIPAGTVLVTAPARVDRSDKRGNPALTSGGPTHFVEAIMGHGPDAISTWTVHIDDALDQGLIEANDAGAVVAA